MRNSEANNNLFVSLMVDHSKYIVFSLMQSRQGLLENDPDQEMGNSGIDVFRRRGLLKMALLKFKPSPGYITSRIEKFYPL
jgi:hypothetical protein